MKFCKLLRFFNHTCKQILQNPGNPCRIRREERDSGNFDFTCVNFNVCECLKRLAKPLSLIHNEFFCIPELCHNTGAEVRRGGSVKNGVLNSFAKFSRKHLCRSVSLKMQQTAGWLKWDSDAISCQFCEIFKNTYFEELRQTTVNNSNKLPVQTGIRKDSSWSICQIWCCRTSEYLCLLKPIWLLSRPTPRVTCADQSNFRLCAIKL